MLVLALVCTGQTVSTAAVAGRPDRDKIVLAWDQGADMSGVRWHALTHVAYTFVTFNSSAALSGTSGWQTRDATMMPNGAAKQNGVKVLLTLANGNNFDETILDSVMTDSTKRNTLITNVMAQVTNATYGGDGIVLDFEFNWSSTTRDGMMQFVRDLKAACDAAGKSLMMYTLPSWSSTQYDAATLRDYLNYVIPSGYDYATGSTASAIGRYGSAGTFSIVGNTDNYIAAGIPADHIVIALPLYEGRWSFATGAGNYGASGTALLPENIVTANYETKWASTPYTKNASSPLNHWTKWYKKSSSTAGQEIVTTFDDAQTLEYKLRLAKAWTGANSQGKELAGVAFWSLAWSQETTSVDPNAVASGDQSFTRNSAEFYYLLEELFAPRGTTQLRADTFETSSINPRWRTPTEGPDDVNLSAASRTISVQQKPGVGAVHCGQVSFTFSAANGKFLFKFQPLLPGGAASTSAGIDWGSAIALVDKTTKFMSDLYVPAAYAGLTIRMVVRDGNNQLEAGPAVSLASSGWKTLTFDLANDVATAYTTGEGGCASGNGTVDTAGSGARDIAFVGFAVQGNSSAFGGNINFDNLLYQQADATNQAYKINEFRYATAAQQFVEIKGTPGAVTPAGLTLRFCAGATGAVSSSVSVGGQTIPGSGLLLVGASGLSATRNVALTDGAISATAPGAIQLFDTATGTTHDSVVYGAYSGVGLLSSPGNPVVTDLGPPYFGDVASGANSAGTPYSAGRYPDGASTGVEGADFSFMPATPGAANGKPLTLPVTYDFTAAPADAFQTFNNFAVTAQASIPASVGQSAGASGGNVYRCIDPTGGGQMAAFGDAPLGSTTGGYKVTGRVFVPADGTAANAHAIGLGICGRSGSNFFGTASPPGYESGYWLIYENAAGVGLNDGQADHPGTFQLVYANNTGVANQPATTLLGSATRAATGAAAGTWTDFSLLVQPAAPAARQIEAKINGATVYSGAVPAGGPTTGAFQVGFRENHTGAPTAVEGTWIDTVTIASPNSGIGSWELY